MSGLHNGRISKELIGKILMGNRLHIKLRFLSPDICKQSLGVKSWKAKESVEKATKHKIEINNSEHQLRQWKTGYTFFSNNWFHMDIGAVWLTPVVEKLN